MKIQVIIHAPLFDFSSKAFFTRGKGEALALHTHLTDALLQ